MTPESNNAITGTGALVAFAAGALIAGGASAAIAIYDNPRGNGDVRRTLRSAGAGGALNLGLYLWVPAVFRDVWSFRSS